MDNNVVIKQLEKALECKDDKELRMRIEVLVDILKETPRNLPSISPVQPVQPLNIPTTYETFNKPANNYLSSNTGQKITGKKGNQVRGAGSITSVDSEQINYQRPKGT